MRGDGLSSMRTRGLLFAVTLGGVLGAAFGFFAGGFIGALSCDWNTKEAGCVEIGAYGAISAVRF